MPFFVVVFTRLSASFVAALHPQHHNFRKLQLPCLCLPPLVNLAVAALPAPSGSAPLRFALNQGKAPAWPAVNFFPAVLRSQSFSPLRKLRSVPSLRWRVNCRNTATSLLTNKKETPQATFSFLFAAVLGGVRLPQRHRCNRK